MEYEVHATRIPWKSSLARRSSSEAASDAPGPDPVSTPSAAGPALPALGPNAQVVEIRATGKNLDLTPGCWVQDVLRKGKDFTLDQRGDHTFFRTSDGERESEAPSARRAPCVIVDKPAP